MKTVKDLLKDYFARDEEMTFFKGGSFILFDADTLGLDDSKTFYSDKSPREELKKFLDKEVILICPHHDRSDGKNRVGIMYKKS